MPEKDINSCWGYLINIIDQISLLCLCLCVCLCLLLIKKTYGQVLCKSCPVAFASYFNYCHSLRFEQRPDYAFVKRLFRDLFTSQGILSNTMHGVSKFFLLFKTNTFRHFSTGYEFDYVFDWTVLRYKQDQKQKVCLSSFCVPLPFVVVELWYVLFASL